MKTAGVFSRGMARIPRLGALLGVDRVVAFPADAQAREIDLVVGWGRKPTAARAEAWAKRHGLPFVRSEDGFLRSVGLGVSGDPPLSVVLDDLGIYYDARTESRLERTIADADFDAPLLERARRAMDRIRAAGLSKYNDAPPGPVDLGHSDRPRVLVVDQTLGDLSIAGGLADAKAFDSMLAAALAENPGADIVVKTHPDVLAGKKRGYLEHAAGDRVTLFARACTPAALCDAVDRVYAVSSQLGFEAMLCGKPVVCFGAPWYAGWGLTDDRQSIPRRAAKRSLEQLFAAAYLRYARYVDPATGASGEIEDVVEHLALQRETFEKNRGAFVCYGFRFWKRNVLRAYLRSPGNRIDFASSAEKVGAGNDVHVLVWGQRETQDVRQACERRGITPWRVEDGFLRSVGLGSDLTVPASLVVDREGIYYDPTRPSELESILENAEFAPPEIERARALRDRIVTSGVSKYNLGEDLRVEPPQGKRVLLVPGQVEDDASIRLGCRDIRTNLGLLAEVRRCNPDAFVVYKPHPDVLSGNRKGRVGRKEALAECDHVEETASLARCLEAADEVHTLTSLVGFEALLRGKRVVVYGQPFYCGWGLTEDRHPMERRTRRLALDELVAGALIRYPRYLDHATGRFTTPEATIARLLAERDGSRGARSLKISWLRRQLRKAVHAFKGVVHAP